MTTCSKPAIAGKVPWVRAEKSRWSRRLLRRRSSRAPERVSGPPPQARARLAKRTSGTRQLRSAHARRGDAVNGFLALGLGQLVIPGGPRAFLSQNTVSRCAAPRGPSRQRLAPRRPGRTWHLVLGAQERAARSGPPVRTRVLRAPYGQCIRPAALRSTSLGRARDRLSGVRAGARGSCWSDSLALSGSAFHGAILRRRREAFLDGDRGRTVVAEPCSLLLGGAVLCHFFRIGHLSNVSHQVPNFEARISPNTTTSSSMRCTGIPCARPQWLRTWPTGTTWPTMPRTNACSRLPFYALSPGAHARFSGSSRLVALAAVPIYLGEQAAPDGLQVWRWAWCSCAYRAVQQPRTSSTSISPAPRCFSWPGCSSAWTCSSAATATRAGRTVRLHVLRCPAARTSAGVVVLGAFPDLQRQAGA